MGFLGKKSVIMSLIALWCLISSSSAFTEELNHVSQTPSSAPVPAPAHAPYHHGHHHSLPPHHHHPHPHSPAKAPVKPPVYPPTKSPVKPPTKPSVKPPVSPPAKAPVHPPTKSPVKPPVYPPAKAPVKPPTKPPVKPPVYPPKFNRSLVAVRGMVYCKSCKYASSDTLNGALPVQGALVRLECKSKKKIVSETKTDKNGYFLLLGPKTVTNYGFRGCRVYLVKSIDNKCNKVSKLLGGDVGAELKPEKTPGKSAVVVNKLTYGLFNVGPFAFDPVCPK
ncbi:unnamed protein product [Cochlearia groenlandica]